MDHLKVKNLLHQIGEKVCDKVYNSLQQQSVEDLSAVVNEGDDDTIYQIDKDVENIIVPLLEKEAADLGGIILQAEGIGDDIEGGYPIPDNILPEKAALRIIMDPIDGTRGIMYDKRSAFFLAGAALNNGKETKLKDIEVAVMTELSTSKSLYSDTLWAIKGNGTNGERKNLKYGSKSTINCKPSKSNTLLGGFGQISRFFPPGRAILAQIEDEMIETLFPEEKEGKAIIFEDQYISSGGQLYELLMGHDRFIADLRTHLYKMLSTKYKYKKGHTCHPYDICTHLIGKEAGLHLTDIYGKELDAPFDLIYDVDWIGYANGKIKEEVEPVLHKLLYKYELI